MIHFPIETERLVIRPLHVEDAGDLRQDEAWIREKVERFDRHGGMSLWAAVERATGRAVALAGLQWEEIDGRRELDLGCVVAPDVQQGGYGTEAGPDNAVAVHVLEKLEFTPQGETTFEGRRYAFFVKAAPGTRAAPRASGEAGAHPAARS